MKNFYERCFNLRDSYLIKEDLDHYYKICLLRELFSFAFFHNENCLDALPMKTIFSLNCKSFDYEPIFLTKCLEQVLSDLGYENVHISNLSYSRTYNLEIFIFTNTN